MSLPNIFFNLIIQNLKEAKQKKNKKRKEKNEKKKGEKKRNGKKKENMYREKKGENRKGKVKKRNSIKACERGQTWKCESVCICILPTSNFPISIIADEMKITVHSIL